MTKLIVYGILFLIIATVLGNFGWSFYRSFYEPPKDSPSGSYSLEVKQGQTLKEISEKMAQDRVIASTQVLSFHNKQKNISNLQLGTYSLNLPAGPESILDQIEMQTKEKELEIAGNNRPTVSVTIKEGYRADDVIAELDKAGVVESEQLREYLSNPSNFDRQKYPFLPEPLECTYGEISNCAKYYGEGYLYPDTYSFFKESTPKESVNRMLDNFSRKVWTPLKDEIKDQDLHKLIIMASVIEKESGRPIGGVNSTNLADISQERRNIASVLYNRTEIGDYWRSDPTGTYWSGKTFCQQTFAIDGCIFLNDPLADNLYNTYENLGYPIGPITSPQLDNIQAALKPNDTNYLFFVSDASGKKYFAQTNAEHNQNVIKAQQINSGLNLN